MQTEYGTVSSYSLKLVRERTVKYPIDKMKSPHTAALVAREYLKDCDCEHLAVVMLDAANNVIGITTVGVGGLSGMSVAVRDVFKAAIVGRASAIVCSHNHPSGDVNPSKEDVAFTQKMVEAGEVLGIVLLDHVIVSSGMNDDFFAFSEHGLL